MTSLAITSSDRSRGYSPSLGLSAPAPKPALPAEPSSAGWLYRAAAACRQAIPTHTLVARGGVAAGATYRTTLSMPALGRVGLTITQRDASLAVRFDCLSNASHAWLTIRKSVLERSLTQAFGCAAYVDVAHDGSR